MGKLSYGFLYGHNYFPFVHIPIEIGKTILCFYDCGGEGARICYDCGRPVYDQSDWDWDAFKFLNSTIGERAWPSPLYVIERNWHLGRPLMVIDLSPKTNPYGGAVPSAYMGINEPMHMESTKFGIQNSMSGTENRDAGTEFPTSVMDNSAPETRTTTITHQPRRVVPHLRKVFCVNGSFLKGKYKGTMLSATTQYADHKIYPIAFATVDGENDASWSFFFRQMRSSSSSKSAGAPTIFSCSSSFSKRRSRASPAFLPALASLACLQTHRLSRLLITRYGVFSSPACLLQTAPSPVL